MHKKLINEAVLDLTLSVKGPLLIKSGTEGWDPTLPDMQFIRTRHARLGETILIPGSSLKGALRSYSEKIARTLEVACCDPFDDKHSCSNREGMQKLSKENDSSGVYKASCAACKLYGSTNLAGRAAFSDAYPKSDLTKNLTKRTAVAIDRVLGSVAVGPFDFEALMGGELDTQIRLRNFELWQLGLLGLAIRDLCLGRIKIGYGKSRGFGSISGRLEKLELRSVASGGLQSTSDGIIVNGVGASLNSDEREKYGIKETDRNPVTIATNIRPVEDLIASTIFFERKVDSEDWCPPEVMALFTNCVKESWAAYRRQNTVNGGGNG